MLNDPTHVRPRRFFPRNLAFLPMRTAIPVIAVCLMAATAAFASPVAADGDGQDSSWYFNDDPILWGPPIYWSRHPYGGYGGYGHDSDYHATYGIGDSDESDNHAVWHMGHRHGGQAVWVWVPKAPADVNANVLYRIYRNNELYKMVRIDQGQSKGWQHLGNWWFKGADVRIEVWDHETEEHYDPKNPAPSRFGIDKVAMRCFWRCSDISSSSIHTPTRTNIREEGNNVDFDSLSPFYKRLYDTYLEQTPYGYQCDNYDPGSGYHSPNAWIDTFATATKAGLTWKKGDVVGSSFYLGECTSWVQFRIRATKVPIFSNGYKHEAYIGTKLGGEGANWGDAVGWDDNAKAASVKRVLGRTSGYVPSKYSVAQWDHNAGGHVAFVEDVSGDGNTIWVSEMNNGDRQICYLTVRRITRNARGDHVVDGWPHYFIVF